jgi:hypothetical protein
MQMEEPRSPVCHPRPMTPSEKIAYISQEHFGGTFHPNGEPVGHKVGYWVSVPGAKITDELTPGIVFTYMSDEGIDGASYYYVGTWHNEKQWHLSKSVWFGNKELALDTARNWNNKAIWDIEKAEDILVSPPVKVVTLVEREH